MRDFIVFLLCSSEFPKTIFIRFSASSNRFSRTKHWKQDHRLNKQSSKHSHLCSNRWSRSRNSFCCSSTPWERKSNEEWFSTKYGSGCGPLSLGVDLSKPSPFVKWCKESKETQDSFVVHFPRNFRHQSESVEYRSRSFRGETALKNAHCVSGPVLYNVSRPLGM